MNALELIYKSVQDRLPFGYDEFAKAVNDWEIVPVVQCGKMFGGVMVKGNEIHVGFAEKPTASIRKNIREILSPLFEKHGFLVTSVHISNENGLNFCKRLGFVEIAQERDKILLRCDRSKYVN